MLDLWFSRGVFLHFLNLLANPMWKLSGVGPSCLELLHVSKMRTAKEVQSSLQDKSSLLWKRATSAVTRSNVRA